jgi:2-C-methyl-D-erythritol 4-phosphate cytidylyltransferase
VVIAAAGKGKRLGRGTPKQFIRLGGVPLLRRAVEMFASVGMVEEIVVAIAPGYSRKAARMLAGAAGRKFLTIVPGGKERQDSVWLALKGFLTKPDIVLVHDAARPLVSMRLIRRVIDATIEHGCAVPGLRVTDTITEVGGANVRTLDRRNLWGVQTPQGFQYDLLVKAHKAARRARVVATDDAALLERLRIPVRIVKGEKRNLKITIPDDLRVAEMWLKSSGMRT